MFSPKELAPNEDQGVVFGIARRARRTRRLEQMHRLVGAKSSRIFAVGRRSSDHSFQITFPSERLRRHARSSPGTSASGASSTIQQESEREARRDHRVCGRPSSCPPPLPSPGQLPGRVRHRLDRRPRGDSSRFAQQLAASARPRADSSPSRPSSTSSIDQAKTEIVIDRDKIASMGLNMQQVGADLGVDARRQLRQPLQHRRPQLQGHPADRARRPPDPGAARATSTSAGPDGRLVPLCAVATLRDASVEPRTLNRFQQLNAVKLSRRRHPLARRRR